VPAALVSGASRKGGIAAAVALALARDGWDVAITGWRAFDETESWGSAPDDADTLVEELRALGARAAFHEDDLSDPAATARVLDAAEASVGPLTALVNAHAHSGQGGLLETTAEQFDRHLAVNARGTLLLSAEFARRFGGEYGAGRIVNFTSGLPLHGEIGYAASKGAIEWLTVSAAVELGPRGITVNAIAPGPFESKMMAETLARFGDQIAAAAPLGRIGRPDDMAGAARYLASRAGAYVTGAVLPVDGGITL
jgi:3-oxoacyl-[acyl-carrier protein] reductase